MFVTTTILGLIIIYVFVKYYIIGFKNTEAIFDEYSDSESDDNYIIDSENDTTDSDDEDNTDSKNKSSEIINNEDISELVNYKDLISKSLKLESDINQKYDNLIKQIKAAKEE
jgi:hypothetical protein